MTIQYPAPSGANRGQCMAMSHSLDNLFELTNSAGYAMPPLVMLCYPWLGYAIADTI